jgi:hypothetical protein
LLRKKWTYRLGTHHVFKKGFESWSFKMMEFIKQKCWRSFFWKNNIWF